MSQLMGDIKTPSEPLREHYGSDEHMKGYEVSYCRRMAKRGPPTPPAKMARVSIRLTQQNLCQLIEDAMWTSRCEYSRIN